MNKIEALSPEEHLQGYGDKGANSKGSVEWE